MPNAETRNKLQQIGKFRTGYGMRVAEEFALLAAVDINDEPDGAISLSIAKLKPGVTWNDIAALRHKLGLS